MTRITARHWFGLIVIIAFAVLGYALLRPRDTFTPSVPARPIAVKPLSSTSGPDEWVMEGHDPARTRSTGTVLTLPLTRKRELQVPADETAGSPLTIGRDMVFVETENTLTALDLDTGKQRWAVYENGSYISPAVAGSTVYMRIELANKGTLFALDTATGDERWRFTPERISTSATNYWGGHLTSPVVSHGKVFIGAGQEVYALDASTGRQLWRFNGADLIAGSAAVAGGRVYISDASFLYALREDNGELVWKTPVSFAVYFSPVVANGTVYVSSGKSILAVSATDGSKRWEASYEGEQLAPTGVEGTRLFVSSQSKLRALDTATGRELWLYKEPNYLSSPAIAQGKLLVTAGSTGETRLVAIDAASGKAVWEEPVDALATEAPVIAGGTVYVRTEDGHVLKYGR
ncbi:MAG: PQQ-binding-like beta-propeller repeat protein [Chloroflexota bacterium]|nr:PQQ-binding-like beta-propeller repeat protein [Chloroflexota bacterium]